MLNRCKTHIEVSRWMVSLLPQPIIYPPSQTWKANKKYRKKIWNGSSKQYSADLHIGTCWFSLCCKLLPSRKLQRWSCLFTTWIMTEKLVRLITTMSNHYFRNRWCSIILSSLLLSTAKTRHLLTLFVLLQSAPYQAGVTSLKLLHDLRALVFLDRQGDQRLSDMETNTFSLLITGWHARVAGMSNLTLHYKNFQRK